MPSDPAAGAGTIVEAGVAEAVGVAEPDGVAELVGVAEAETVGVVLAVTPGVDEADGGLSWYGEQALCRVTRLPHVHQGSAVYCEIGADRYAGQQPVVLVTRSRSACEES